MRVCLKKCDTYSEIIREILRLWLVKFFTAWKKSKRIKNFFPVGEAVAIA